MTPRRVAAAIAVILTALILQATLIAPLAGTAAVSLPVVLVAAVAVFSGPGTGIAFGFVMGLLADLGSEHPAGVLALTWLAVGIGCGLLGQQLTRLREAVLVASVSSAVAATVATLLLTMLGSGGATLRQALWQFPAALIGDAALACCLMALVRAALATAALRRPAPLRPDSILVRHG